MSKRKQMRLLTLIVSFLAALTSGTQTGTLPPPLPYLGNIFQTSHAETSSYEVVHVVDGDTLDILKRGEKVRVRLIGINSPESVDPRRPVECFGKEASRYASSLADGKFVTLELDPSQGEFDKYKASKRIKVLFPFLHPFCFIKMT